MIISNRLNRHFVKSVQASMSMLLRGNRGNMGTAMPIQPEKMLIIYEHEACPYARRVREVMTYLNLDFESRPSPKHGRIYRNELVEIVGKSQVPFLIDENTGDQILDSQAIIDHLFMHYSNKGSTPKKFQKKNNQDNASLTNKAASVVSMMRGGIAHHPKMNEARGKPDEPLHLYGFEASPFCRLVRERLSELEVGYVNHSVAREQLEDIGAFGARINLSIFSAPRNPDDYQPVKGGKRERIKNEIMTEKLQFPYLVDPNTDTQWYESKDIIEYLNQTYG